MKRVVALALFVSCVAVVSAASGERQASPGEVRLGSVRLRQRVLADGKPLGPGSYEIRVTSTPATPVAPGETARFERWAEFLQKNEVKGREVVTVIPPSEVNQVAKETPPKPGAHRVEVLKENHYVRIWFNDHGTQYLFHLPPA